MENTQMDDMAREQAAELLSMRIAVVALFKSHPQPERLRQALRETLQMPGTFDGQMPAPMQTRVDRTLSFLDSLLVPADTNH